MIYRINYTMLILDWVELNSRLWKDLECDY